MPGLPSTTSEIESPTGCTKQLMRVAWSWMPAAELMRPAGMKPSFCACRKRRSQCARRSSGSTWASARATRRRTSSTLASLPLAYFSSSVSREMSCGGASVTVRLSILEGHTVAVGAARVLQEVGDLVVPHAQGELDRRVAFLAGHRRVGTIAQQQLDHRRVALH